MFQLCKPTGEVYSADLHEIIYDAAPTDADERFRLLCDSLEKVIQAVANPSALAEMIQAAVITTPALAPIVPLITVL